jgi:hypothetical protein
MKKERQLLLEENSRLRAILAKLGVNCDERRPGRSLEEENRRLRQDLSWFLKMRERIRDNH